VSLKSGLFKPAIYGQFHPMLTGFGHYYVFCSGFFFQRLQTFLECFEPMSYPDRAHATWRHKDTVLFESVGDTYLPQSRILQSHFQNRFCYNRIHSILWVWLTPAQFAQALFPLLIVQLLEPVEAIPGIAHNLAGFTHISQLLS